MSADARLREAFLGATAVAEGTPCPSADVLWHAARGDLTPAAMGGVLDHVVACGPCTEDFRLAREVAQEAPAAERAPLWRRMAAAFVAPAPALAYLVLAGVCLVLLVRGRPAPVGVVAPASPATPAPIAAPAPPAPIGSLLAELRLTGDVVTRGGSGGSSAVPVPRERVLLRLYPDLVLADLGDADRLRVRVSAAGSVLWEEERTARQLAPDGSLPFLLDTSSRAPGEILTVAIDHVGGRGDAASVLVQTLRVTAR